MSCINTCHAMGRSLSICMDVRVFAPALTLLYILSYTSACSLSSNFHTALIFQTFCVCRLRWSAFPHVLGSWVTRCCRVILGVPVPGVGLHGNGGDGSGGCSGLWGWVMMSFSYQVAMLLALVLFVLRKSLPLSPMEPKVMWRP